MAMSRLLSIPLLIIWLMASAMQAFHSSSWSPPSTRAFVMRSPSTQLSAVSRGGNSGGRRQMPVKEVRPPMNEEISAATMRVTTPNPKGKDELLGIMSREEAMAKAREMGDLDLILVNNNSDPPVCRIVDYSKYRYAQEKKAKEVKKNSKASELKEVKMSYKIDVHDYDVRKKSAFKFLRQGNRVKCTVMFRGREVQHDNLGFDLLERLATELEATCVKENRPKREGRVMSLILAPRPEVMKALNEERRKLDKLKKQKRIERLENPGMVDDDDEDDDEDAEEEEDDDYEEDDDENDDDMPAPKARADKTLEELLGTDEYL